mmetsp:Transcript_49151/g.107117  ORF Transcript_49151/g.107117 Transcript_49151/m.107117 type:complete len:507 (-) Transcript_49151:19-1539(-)|eukprot:CAMPEP_0204320074 /NCGR_PEP_ID=MMETSP0469-20131031/7456_1 /ASSEMBLY_ACC=CAM_ASM_000384 /TAXON_ID=2969 /ORGANISM="Oxyrrhis marina" /LENGTH=506 /DNA_ID=CAMNT_0051301329 /DNA_START=41 /DNA_END=1561 /DNA_ORIENTATION=-
MGCAGSKVDYGLDDQGRQFQDLYKVGKVLGKGSYGVVREVVILDGSNERFAAKIMQHNVDGQQQPKEEKQKLLAEMMDKLDNPDITEEETEDIGVAATQLRRDLAAMITTVSEEEIAAEINLMKECVHENIMRLHNVFQSPTRSVLILTLCGRDLEEARPFGGWPDEAAQALLMRGLMEALVFLHSIRILHRDVKPENVMLDRCDNVILADFGLACKLQDGQKRSLDVAGTTLFFPPEAVVFGQSPAGDVWAAACTLFWIIFDDEARFSFHDDAAGIGKGVQPPGFDRTESKGWGRVMSTDSAGSKASWGRVKSGEVNTTKRWGRVKSTEAEMRSGTRPGTLPGRMPNRTLSQKISWKASSERAEADSVKVIRVPLTETTAPDSENLTASPTETSSPKPSEKRSIAFSGMDNLDSSGVGKDNRPASPPRRLTRLTTNAREHKAGKSVDWEVEQVLEKAVALHRQRPDRADQPSSSALHLLNQMLQGSPQLRISSQGVLNHSWISGE